MQSLPSTHWQFAPRTMTSKSLQLYALDRVARTIWGNFVARVRHADLGSGLLDWSQPTDGPLVGIRFLEPEILEPPQGEPVWLDGTKAL